MIRTFSRFLFLTLFLLSSTAFSELKRELNLEWEPIQGASSYEIKLSPNSSNDSTDNEDLTFKVEESKWVGNITPGKYKMKMRSFDKRKVPGPWSDEIDVEVKLPIAQIIAPKMKKIIRSENDENHNVMFKWQKVFGALKYELAITNKDQSISKSEFSEENQMEVELNVAQTYSWNVRPIFEDDVIGPSNSKMHIFKILGKKVEPPEIEKPNTPLVRELKWSSPKHSESFSYVLQKKNKTNKKWKTVEKAKKLKVNAIPFNEAYPEGTYRISVKAHSKNRKSSIYAKEQFDVAKDRSPAAVEEQSLKDSLKKNSNFYAIASYFITQIQYSAYSAEYDSRPNFKTVGGTGRLGIGYNFSDSPWGVFGIIDAGGFVQNGSNRVFTSGEFHTTWSTDLGGNQRFLIGGGIYSKELPYFASTTTDSSGEVYQTARQNGLHIGLEYWKPFSQKLGFQILYRMYLGIESGRAPNDTSLLDADSSQIGFLGSYKLSKTMVGFMGYNYKQDLMKFEAKNPASTSSSNISEISHEGHYLNFKLEVEF